MYTIIWTIEATEDYLQNINYLEEEFPETVVFNFIDRVEKVIQIISSDPFTFEKSDYKEIHQVPVVPQVTMFYRVVQNKEVLIVRLWNNFKNKSNLKI